MLFLMSELAADPILLNRQAQRSISMTVYNGNFAVIREVREIDLPLGLNTVEYREISQFIEPASVIVRSMNNGNKLIVREQSYQQNLLNRDLLLKSYLGRQITLKLNSESGTEIQTRVGELLAVSPEIVRFPEGIEISPAGSLLLPELPDHLDIAPTLTWLVDNKVRGRQSLETSYLTRNISWQADYVLVLDGQDGNRFDLDSWVTIQNSSGTAFNDVAIQVIAGDVNRKVVTAKPEMRALSMNMQAAGAQDVQAQAVFEYHQYNLPGKTSLQSSEMKQVRFRHAEEVVFAKTYRLTSQGYNYQMQETQKSNVDVFIAFNNSRQNNLGQPLPAGTVRVYVADSDGVSQLVGEDRVKHTAADELVELKLGSVFDVTAERRQSHYRRLRERLAQAGYVIELSNSKDEAVEVTVREKLQGDWQILEESEPGERVDSTTYEFSVTIPAKASKTVSYAIQWQF